MVRLPSGAYAGGIALFLRWCARSGRSWEAGAGQFGLFMTWLAHAGRAVSGAGEPAGAAVLAGPGTPAARSARRISAVLAAVRGMIVHAVAEGTAGGYLVQVLYEVADDRDLPPAARAGKRPGRAGGCVPGTGCTNRSRGWPGPMTVMWLRCSARAVRHATG